MNVGKTLFAQVMNSSSGRPFIASWPVTGATSACARLTCAELLRCMAFTPLTYGESLRDIDACLTDQAAKLYHMGFRQPVRRSTLANANESCDRRIYTEFAQRLIVQARKLYAGDALGVELSNTVYALDATTIDLCLGVPLGALPLD